MRTAKIGPDLRLFKLQSMCVIENCSKFPSKKVILETDT